MGEKAERADFALEVEDLHKSYGAVKALDGVTFSVPRGAFYGLFGRNGAGKTTTFDIVTGLLGRDRGRVRMLGVDVGAEPLPALKQRFAYVGGHLGLYQWLTLEQHLTFVAGFYDAWDHARCTELREVFRLPMERRAWELSPGQHLQFQLVMALSRHPELLILDEPGNLDPVVRRRLMATMADVLRAEDATILMASHLLDELEGVCDHMCILDRGRTLVAGPVRELVAEVRQVRFHGVAAEQPPALVGVWHERLEPGEWRAVMARYTDQAAADLAAKLGASGYDVGPVSLEEFFVALTEDRD
jgi:ABC-2 type transport system ATP-binding protein